jgi:uncharacterized cupredoxin-like copper-binding protein
MSIRTLVLIPVAVLALTGVACGSDEPTSTDGSDGGDGVTVTLRDFAIELGASSAPAGSITFEATNDGPSVHEFEVIDTDIPADQFEVDSGVAATTADGSVIVDEVEEIAPGTNVDLTVDLEPGAYALVCNIAGHYEQGMFASFTVE